MIPARPRDLFTAADCRAVLHGDRHGRLAWEGDLPALDSKMDDAGREYLVCPGTPYVATRQDTRERWSLWLDGLCGTCTGESFANREELQRYIKARGQRP